MLIEVATQGIFTEGPDADSVVVDLGANENSFSSAILQRFHCRVVAVEPDPTLAERLSTLPGVQVVEAAVADRDGIIDFHVSENAQMSGIFPVDNAKYLRLERVKCLTFETLLQSTGLERVDLLKVDIEGAEFRSSEDISDARLVSIAQVTIELHDFNGMISVSEADAIESRMGRLGFKRIRLSRTNRENILFFNPLKCRLSPANECWVRLISRNHLGFRRMLAMHFACPVH